MTRERVNFVGLGGRRIELDKRVEESIDLGDKVIVLFYVNDYEVGDMMVGRNIVALDGEGEQMWRVADHGLRRRGAPEVPDAYFDIHIDEDGRLWGGLPGLYAEIDLDTGELIGSKSRY